MFSVNGSHDSVSIPISPTLSLPPSLPRNVPLRRLELPRRTDKGHGAFLPGKGFTQGGGEGRYQVLPPQALAGQYKVKATTAAAAAAAVAVASNARGKGGGSRPREILALKVKPVQRAHSDGAVGRVVGGEEAAADRVFVVVAITTITVKARAAKPPSSTPSATTIWCVLLLAPFPIPHIPRVLDKPIRDEVGL